MIGNIFKFFESKILYGGNTTLSCYQAYQREDRSVLVTAQHVFYDVVQSIFYTQEYRISTVPLMHIWSHTLLNSLIDFLPRLFIYII